MKDKEFIPLDGGPYGGCKAMDREIRYGEEDVLVIRENGNDTFYLIEHDIVGRPTPGRKRRTGRTWVVDAGDLIA